MSKFFKALEQADRERALREAARQADEVPAGSGSRAGTPPRSPAPSAPPPAPAPHVTASAVIVDAPPRPTRPMPRVDLGRAVERVDAFDPAVDAHLVSLLHPTGFEAEQYRSLRHWMEQLHRGSGVSVVAVTSSDVGDGKTTTAINLAGSLAQAPDARVLLIEADFRRPSAAKYLGLGGHDGRGLVDAILDPNIGLEDIVRSRPPFNLALAPAGNPPAAPYEILKSPRLGDLLEEARRRYDYVVLDTPPLVPVPDCRLIGKWIDGFLVVVAAHKTPRKLVEEGLNVLDSAKVLGLVFNEDNHPLSGYYDRPYHRIVESKPAPGWRFPWPPRRPRRLKTRASEQWH